MRAVFEVPADRGYVVGDIKIAGRPIEFGAQIADFITIKLEGLATRIGQSTAVAIAGCHAAAGPPAMIAAAPPAVVPAVPAFPLQRRLAAATADAGALGRDVQGPEAEAALLARLPPALRRDLEHREGDGAAPPALLRYPKLPQCQLGPRVVSGKIMAYASPDSTYAVTKRLIESAQRSVVIGIYDFSADYMKEHLKRAMRRGVALSLMLDTNADDERDLLGELAALGANCVKAPSSSAGNPIAYFGNAHEKIIVVDDEIVMIQSGNWSENSIPLNEGDGVIVGSFQPGNRDMGLAIQSRELAAFFSELVARDMRLAQGQPAPGRCRTARYACGSLAGQRDLLRSGPA